jgi:heat shock protein HslJ
VVVASIGTACGTSDRATDPDRLVGVTWVLDEASITTLTGGPIPGARADLRFEDGQAGGASGCNIYGGTYDAGSDGSIAFEAMSMTEMACDEPRMALEAAFVGALAEATTFEVGEQTLTLTGGPTLRFTEEVPMEPLALEGTTWALDTIAAGSDAVSSVVAGTEPTLLLGDGVASGSTGCNRFTGGYTVTPRDGLEHVTGDLAFGALAATEMACDEAVMAQEDVIMQAMSRVTRWLVEGDRLSLFDAKGGLMLAYRGSPA